MCSSSSIWWNEMSRNLGTYVSCQGPFCVEFSYSFSFIKVELVSLLLLLLFQRASSKFCTHQDKLSRVTKGTAIFALQSNVFGGGWTTRKLFVGQNSPDNWLHSTHNSIFSSLKLDRNGMHLIKNSCLDTNFFLSAFVIVNARHRLAHFYSRRVRLFSSWKCRCDSNR